MIDPDLIARCQEFSRSTGPVSNQQLREAIADVADLTLQTAEALSELVERSGPFDMGHLSVSLN